MQQVISSKSINLIHHESYASHTSVAGLFKKFIAWCDMQEKNGFLWLGIALMGGIGTILPLTLLAIVFGASNNFGLWITACVVNIPILIVHLAVQPKKITLPVLFFAWIVDAVIIAYCLAVFFVR